MAINKQQYWIVNKLDNGIAEILLYGDIFPYEDCVNAKGVAQEIKELEKTCSKINVRINSGGGSVFEGIAIFNVIRNSKCEIDTYIDGIAASMGSVIAIAGKKVYMSKYARLMTHKPSGGAWGTALELRKAADAIDDCESIASDIYAARTGLSKAQVAEKFLNGTDVYFNAEAAKKAGLIDDIYDGEPVDVPKGVTDFKEVCALYNTCLMNGGSDFKHKQIIILS
jgi:ATP-dependent Clp endopeptidase proteolytic subunit ClpP